jgi:hypothetical protein
LRSAVYGVGGENLVVAAVVVVKRLLSNHDTQARRRTLHHALSNLLESASLLIREYLRRQNFLPVPRAMHYPEDFDAVCIGLIENQIGPHN